MARPVDGASLAVVRIVYGLVGVLVALRILANGWIDSLYAGPERHFTYPGLRWVAAPPSWGMHLLVAAIGIAGLLVALGWHYRIALGAFLVAFTWLEFIELTTYLNHYWFVTLFGVVLLALPAASCWSLDARRRGAPTTIPIGALWLVRAQVAVVYMFAGLAKLNADWLLRGLPLRLWLPAHSDFTIVGPWLDEPWFAIALSWAGAAFDCLIVPALLWKRTRPFAWCAVVAFHFATWRLFPIGVFPWVMIAVSTAFFAPGWPREFARRWFRHSAAPAAVAPAPTIQARRISRGVIAIALVWVALQIALPLRHLLIPGDYRWTNEGYRFAWTVLLTEKGGDVSFRVTDTATGRRWIETGEDLYTASQWRMMATEPELVRQAAHAIAARQRSRGRQVEVRADAFVSLNGRPAERLVRPDVDLAREPWRPHQDWILPAPRSTPLPGR